MRTVLQIQHWFTCLNLEFKLFLLNALNAITAAVDWSLNLQTTPIAQVHVTSYYEGLIVQGDFCSHTFTKFSGLPRLKLVETGP